VLLVAMGYVALPFLRILIFDFFIYWFRRIQHGVPILWRFYSAHHSFWAVT
jgi:sterol desaturase/sphingolipid hydroxylase (fatty acid hydroxylase superfamily)